MKQDARDILIPMLLKVDTRLSGGVAIITFNGRATAGEAADAIRSSLLRAFEDKSRFLLIDCENLSYIDSAALGEMVSAYSFIVKQGGAAKLLRPHARMRHLLKITHLEGVLEIQEDEAAAIAGFHQSSAAKN